jgi:hypothetical protein
MKPFAFAVLLLVQTADAAEFAEHFRATGFYKGNLHAHSNDHAARGYLDGKGDGDAPPDQVVAAYAGLGYDFLALTDHNELTVPSAGGLTLLNGIELTSHYGKKKIPVHLGAVCVNKEEKGAHFDSAADALSGTIAAARAANAALVIVNHPNYAKALSSGDLAGASGFNAVEIASAHPEVEKDDAAAAKSAEEIWDDLLASGADVWAVAADDAHDYSGKVQPGESALRPAGEAWVQAWARASSASDLCAALKAGHFYSSTGPQLKFLSVKGGEISVEAGGNWNAKTDKIEFLKEKGAVLSTSRSAAASYLCDGSEKYVRVRVTQGGKKAWTQAYRLK